MEAIGAGASVLAFVTLGLKSVKIINEIVASVKDGKVFLEQTRQDIQGLQATLEKLRDCRAIVDRNDHQLADKIKSCAEEMKGIAEKLQALAINGSEPALGRQWKKVKIFLKEKDLERIATTAVKHTTALTLYLQTISSDVLLEIKDELSIDRQSQSSTYRSVQDTHSIVAAQQTTITAAVNTIVVDQTHAIQETMREELGIIRQGQSAIASQQTVMTQAIQDVMPKFADQTGTISNVLQAALSEFAAVLDNQMATTIDRALGQLLSRLSIEQNKGEAPIKLKDDTLSINEASLTTTMAHVELENSINCLVDALGNKQGIILLEHSSSITKSFFTLFQAAVDEASFENSPRFMTKYRNWSETCTDHNLAELKRDLTVFQGVLMSSRSVSVNEPSKKASESGYLVHNLTPKRSYDLSFGTLSVTSSSLYPRKRHHGQIVFSSGSDNTEFTQKDVRIRFHPKPGSTPRAVKASIRQLHGSHGTWNSIPRFSVHNILPETSRVFRVLRWGRLRELQEMLQLGEASLLDQDERGRSLLFYGNQQPEMCRFLLQNGADVDHVAPSTRFGKRHTMTNALDRPRSRCLISGETMLEPLFECQKLLLQAGCDPSWIEPLRFKRHPWEYPLVKIFQAGILELMRIFFDHSDGLITPNVIITSGGFTPFLSYCQAPMFNPWYTIETCSFMVSRGADLSTRDFWGLTCVDICIRSIKSRHPLRARGGGGNAKDAMEYLQQVRHSLVYLIQHGAKPSVNLIQHDTNRLVYPPPALSPYEDNVGGHLWDIILADCGFDIATFRTAKYTWRPCRVQRTKWGTLAELYTKEDFMALWKGKEHLCPYYDEVIRTGFEDQLYWDVESDSGEDDSTDGDGDSSDEAQHDCKSGSDDGSDDVSDAGNDDESDDGSNDGSDDDGGCMLEGT